MCSNSERKMRVLATRNLPFKVGKRWVKVELKNGGVLIPSFEDLFRIIQAVCFCEDEKYPTGEGRAMVAKFLQDCTSAADFNQLALKYKIPTRCQEKIINPNGAKINEDYPDA